MDRAVERQLDKRACLMALVLVWSNFAFAYLVLA
jgi:hypothetical protein